MCVNWSTQTMMNVWSLGSWLSPSIMWDPVYQTQVIRRSVRLASSTILFNLYFLTEILWTNWLSIVFCFCFFQYRLMKCVCGGENLKSRNWWFFVFVWLDKIVVSFNLTLRPLCDTESLSDNATAFSNRSKQLRRQMWWRGCKVSKGEGGAWKQRKIWGEGATSLWAQWEPTL